MTLLGVLCVMLLDVMVLNAVTDRALFRSTRWVSYTLIALMANERSALVVSEVMPVCCPTKGRGRHLPESITAYTY